MIRILNVCKEFGNKEILKDINLTINRGQLTFIVGSSGAGKSTLLNIIGGLDDATRGKVYLDAKDISEDLNEYRANKVGFIFQDFNLISGLSISQNVQVGLLIADKKNNEFQRKLSEIGISDLKQKAETLSGGEKQRVAFVRSISKEAEILIADEPTGNLDSANAEIVMELISKMKDGRHIIVVSHDMELAQKYADRIIKISDGIVVEDSQKGEKVIEEINIRDEKNIDVVKNNSHLKNRIKATGILGNNSVKKRFSKIFSIALVIAMAIGMIALVFDYNKLGEKVSKSVNVNYLESDLISVFYDSTANLGYKETPFEKTTIQDIKSKYSTKEIVEVYMDLDSWFFNNNEKTCQAVIKQVNIDDFFCDRIMSYDIKGEFLKDDDSIILAKDVADTLFGEDCIGKTISLNDGSGESIIFNIVGVNYTVNPFDEIYSIVSSNKIKELYERQMTTALDTRIMMDVYKEKKPEGEINYSTGGAYATVSTINNSEEILFGDFPDSYDDIMVSDTVLPYMLTSFEIGNIDDVSQVSEEMLDSLFQKQYVFKYNGIHKVNITGIYHSDNIEFKITDKMKNELVNIKPLIIDAYISNKVDVSTIKEMINNNEDFICSLKLEDLKNSISQQTSFFKIGITAMGIIMIFISIFMLASFAKITVLERTKEIAIIKCLGASNRHIMSILAYDAIIISIIAFILSCILTKLWVEIIPRFLGDMSFVRFSYPFKSLLIINIISVLLVICYTLISMKKLVRRTPAELLKQ